VFFVYNDKKMVLRGAGSFMETADSRITNAAINSAMYIQGGFYEK
jgi:hypothetical protein